MKKIKVMMIVVGTMLMIAFSNFSIAQTDTSRTGSGTDKTTPGISTPGSQTSPGTQGAIGTNRNNTLGNRSDSSGNASMYYSHAQKAADDLKTRLNLTSEQTSQVRDVLIDYQSDLAEQKMSGTSTSPSSEVGGTTSRNDLHQTINERIETILNDNQKQEFSSMQTEWWSKIDNDFNSGAKSKKGTGTEKSGMGTDKNKSGTGTDKEKSGTDTDNSGTNNTN